MAGGSLGESEHQPPKEMNRKRVLMTSVIGTTVTVKPGDILRIGTVQHFSCCVNGMSLFCNLNTI